MLSLLSACNIFQRNKDAYKLTPHEFIQRLETTKGVLIDVRTPNEFNTEHIAGAVNFNIQSDKFNANSDSIDKTRPCFLYCAIGGRSLEAYKTMKKNGFKYLFVLDGALVEWKRQNMPLTNFEFDMEAMTRAPKCIGTQTFTDFSNGKIEFRRVINEYCDTSWQVVTTIHDFLGVGKFTTEYAYNRGLLKIKSHEQKQSRIIK